MSTSPRQYTLTDALKWYDDDSRSTRVERIEWASALFQPPGMIVGGFLPLSLIEEARLCYVNGQFMGALLCAASAAEHMLVEKLATLGLAGGRSTLGPSIRAAKEGGVLSAATCENLEKLIKIRNPLVHRREPFDPSTLAARYQAQSVHPNALLEEDARFALLVMYEVFHNF